MPTPVLSSVVKVLKVAAPPPKLTVSQWSDRNRILSPEGSAEPGRWSTARAEYQRGIMDAFSDPAIEVVVVMKSAQVGYTEMIGNVVGYHVDQDPAPMLMVQPTIEMGEAWSKDRFAPMLRDTPSLADRVAPSRARDSGNTLLHKSFPGGHISIAGANSPASLASRPIRVVLLDEVDRYPASAGQEGDPITLARKRTATFWNRKILMGSTPTVDGVSRIQAAFDASDRRRFWVPCPHCDQLQTLQWVNVRWTDDDATSALYHCIGCGAGWRDSARWQAVRKGEWRAEGVFKKTAGFHISELYSPWRKLEDTVGDFLAAKARPEMLKAWKNTALGEVWQEQGEAPDWERLIERREPFLMGVVPRGAVVLTAGVDNHNDRLELAVWAWAPGYESWLVDTKFIYGHPGENAVWDELAETLGRQWPCEGGGHLRIAKIGIDTGGSYTSAVYGQIRRLRDPRIVPLKGIDGWNRATPVSGPTLVDVLENGKKLKKGLRLWTVSVSTFKGDLYRRLWLGRGDGIGFPSGWVHLSQGTDAEQVKQLVAEQLVTVKDRRGFARMEWHKLRDRNEQLDMCVYARAALSVMGSDRYGDRFWGRMRKPSHDIVVPPPKDKPPTPAAPAIQGPVYPAPPPKQHVQRGPVIKVAEQQTRRGLTSRMAGA
jgi:phage terminase large subunit GpA-like protein